MSLPLRFQIVLKVSHGLRGLGGGAASTFCQLWMRTVLSMSPSQIGIVTAAFSLTSIIAVPMLCGLFDRLARPHFCFCFFLVLNVLVHALYPLLSVLSACMPFNNFASWLVLYMPVMILGESLDNATSSLMDALTFLALPNKLAYGKIRMWSGFMWALSAQIAGSIMDLPGFSLNMNWMIFCAANSVLLVLWIKVPVSLQTPCLEGREVFNQNEQAIGAKTADDATQAAGSTQLSWPLIECLLLMFAMGTANACMNSFVFLLMQDLGGSTSLMGISIAINICTEVPVFHFSQEIMQRLGTRGVMYVGMIAYFLRLLWYGVAWSPASVLIAEPLHGLTFALIWSNLAVIGADISPPGLEATTQGVINAVFNGIGGVTGAVVGGYLYDVSPKVMFWSAASLVTCMSFLMMVSDIRRRWKQSSNDVQLAGMGENLAQTP